MEYKIQQVNGKQIPEKAQFLSSMAIEEQLNHFGLYYLSATSHSITDANDRFSPWNKCKGGDKVEITDQTLFVQDGVIVGIRLDADDEIFCFENPVGKIEHFGGYRESMDYWDYCQDHAWYEFRFEPKE